VYTVVYYKRHKCILKMTSEQPGKSKDIIHTSILLAVALCIGLYLISTTAIIAKDGVTFIEYAKNLAMSPKSTMLSQEQHPGYPFLILTAHRIAKISYKSSPLYGWVYSAQIVALIFRLLAIAALYFVGKEIVKARFSFLAVLILIVLPNPAEYGSDALSDWPHLFFLVTGFLLLIYGATGRKWWLFGFAGLAAGIGYLIRPECVQLLVFGSLWLGLQLFRSKHTVGKYKTVFALILLLIGFFIAAGPYMKLKGAVFPKKHVGRLSLSVQSRRVNEQEPRVCSNTVYSCGFVPTSIARALGKLVERVSEVLMWFFLPPLLIGTYKYFRKRNWREPGKFFITALIALNISLMVWLYCEHGYISRRHTLPLVVFTILYVPAGLEVWASWLQKKFSKDVERSPAIKSHKQFWFLVLFVIGISICIPKLLTPIRTEKQSYRAAAQWLAKNTNQTDIIAVPDLRISFYSGRRGIGYSGQTIPREAQYVVKVFKNGQDLPTDEQMLQAKKFIGGNGGKSEVIIYRRAH